MLFTDIQSSVDAIEISDETREDENFHLRRYIQDLATKFNSKCDLERDSNLSSIVQ